MHRPYKIGMMQIQRVRQKLNWVWVALALVFIAGALILLPMTSAVAVIGGALLVLALLRWHELALYVAILAVPYGSWFPVQISVGNLTAVDLFVALLIVLWLARLVVQERGVAIRFPPLSLPFTIFLGAALLSMTVALSLQFAIKEFVKWLEMFAMYVYVANNLDAAKIKRVLAAMFVAGLSEAAIGIYQFLFRVGPEGFSLFGRFMRAYGTFEQPNPYAGYLAIIIPVALGAVLWFVVGDLSPNQRAKARATNIALAGLAAVSLAAMLTAVVMSWSRGAWLGVAAGLIVTVMVQSRRAFVLTIIVGSVLTFVILLSSINIIPEAIAARFSGITDYFGVFDVRGVKVDDANFAIVERMAHWQSAAMMFAEYPVLGVGIGNYAPVYPAYALPHWSDPLGHAHNYYLNVAAETGLIGLLAYGILWVAAFWQSWHAVRVSNGFWRGVAAGLLGMLVALSAHNTFDNLFVHGMAVQVGIGLGIVAWLRNAVIGDSVIR
jgi:putative inorganic carbon (HCO3(-)) transporter